MNTLWLRRLIKKHDTLGHLVAGFVLLAHYLFVRRRNFTLSALIAACAASAAGISLLHRAEPKIACSCAIDAGPAAYKIVDLGTMRGAQFVAPYGVNSQNQVVGAALMENDDIHAFIWQNGRFQDLGGLGGTLAAASGINDRGQVSGVAETADETIHGFVWQSGKIRDLTPQRHAFSVANGINDAGQVIGWAYNERNESFRATIWTDFKPKDIGALPGDSDSMGNAINNKGEAVGTSTGDYETWRPFVYRGGRPEPIPMPTSSGFATGINDSGQVVGAVEQGENIRAFTTINGRSALLPMLGGSDSIAFNVNDSGLAVGLSTDRADEARAVGWQGGRVVDLNTLLPSNSGWRLYFAFGVGKQGQVVGVGVHNGQLRAYLLTPEGRG
jgi:probable HAF family extracellular repeat protein